MPRLSPISSRDLAKILDKLGFTKIRQVGSHARFIHSGENVHRGLLRKILRDLDLSPEEFSKLR